MGDLIFWMGIILVVFVFGWLAVAEMFRRADRGEKPINLPMAIKLFLVTCGVICLSIGRNSFTPENLDAGGSDTKVTVTEKEAKDLETKRKERKVNKKKAERKASKKNEGDLLDDMKDFKKRVMER